MNNYSDVDPRVDTSKVDAKADRLINQAKSLGRKDTNPLQQIKKDFDNKGIQEGEEEQDIQPFPKQDLPRCWLDPNYRN
jgi:hypothetical protein